MKVLFISDIHLGARYMGDTRTHEARVVNFLRNEAHDADSLYLLGDILDYWFEYRNVVPRGFIRFFGELAALSDAGVKITWMTGNHDIWLFDYLRDELGIEVVDAPYIVRKIGTRRFILAHGDRIGRTTAGFRFICSLFRNKVCQKLYSGLHPRITVPFAKAWSNSSRCGKGTIDDAEIPDTQARGRRRQACKSQPGYQLYCDGTSSYSAGYSTSAVIGQADCTWRLD